MGASNFGDKFLKSIQLIAIPDSDSEKDYESFNNLVEFTINPFIKKQNKKLNFINLELVNGYYEGIQVELSIKETGDASIDEMLWHYDYQQEDFDKEFKNDLEIIKETILKANENCLDVVNVYSPWLKPDEYKINSSNFKDILETNLKNLSNDLYDVVTSYEGYENHTNKIIETILDNDKLSNSSSSSMKM